MGRSSFTDLIGDFPLDTYEARTELEEQQAKQANTVTFAMYDNVRRRAQAHYLPLSLHLYIHIYIEIIDMENYRAIYTQCI